MRNAALTIAILTTLLLGGQTPSPIQQKNFQRDLDALTKRGFTYRMLDNDLIELTDPMSGEKRLKSLREPSEATIRAWAAQHGIPILEIDPTQVDTSLYNGWYTYFTTVPLSDAFQNPLVVADLDRNGKPECYGIYDDPSTNYEDRCYEIDSNGTVTLRHNYSPLQFSASRLIVDADGDSLKEVIFTQGGFVSDYEQSSPDSLATVLRFNHNQYESGDPGYSGIYVGSLDGDNFTDFLYKGSEVDSSGGTTKVYVAEYNQQANNFVRVWSTNYDLGGVAEIGGFAVDDFDKDGKIEFVASEFIHGRVFVAENTGNDLYAITWQDTTPFVNLDQAIGGDVDGDGKPEFFIGGTTFDGSWTIVYEADSNNQYSPRFMFHLAGGFFDFTYLVTDVDGDGQPEFVVLGSGYLHVFKASGDDRYRLWYFRHDDNTHSVQFYDVNSDGRKDILISKGMNGIGLYTDVYKATSLVHVEEGHLQPVQIQLHQNYPNPFNPTTTISYELPADSKVTLKVFDVLGREVATLVDGFKPAGHHQTSLNGTKLASGVYLYRLQSGRFTSTKKLLLLK